MTKIGRTMAVSVDLLREHEAQPYGLPTNPRFVAYELEQRGQAVKPDPDDKRPKSGAPTAGHPGSRMSAMHCCGCARRARSRGSGSATLTGRS